ncbi:MAG: acyl-CoA dehydrogenase C-terminal domain-containing protein [Deltaproteobacteria bacterium]|nr:acyl-CoA dehydrogenase C-terminal domain-containing protein [Deltaproteobacteria bacterium]
MSGFEKEMGSLRKGLDCIEDLKALYDSWYVNIDEEKSLISLNAVNTLFVCTQVQFAECLMEQALIAQKKLEELPDDHHDRNFYKGKIAAAKYYVNQVLPNAFTQTDVIRSEDTFVLDCPEEALVVS